MAAAPAGKGMFSMVVDGGASVHFMDSELIPDFYSCLQSYQGLKPPMTIITAGRRCVYGTATGVVSCAVMDATGVEREITVRVTVVPGMGKHICFRQSMRKRRVYIPY